VLVKRLAVSLSFSFLVLLPAFVSGETVTLPAVTSLPPGAAASPFFSDVRVFNTSYSSPVSVTAVYRCFIPQGCSAAGRSAAFSLSPRESRAFDDMILSVFNAPSTAGAVEFTSSGSDIRVTSRLYSTAPIPTVGMFIPGLKNSEAHSVSVLTSLANGAFRTNIGVYNGEDSAVVVTIKLFNGTVQLGSQVVSLGPRSGTQINRIFDAVGQGGLITTNAYAVVETGSNDAEVFSYAAVIDNATTDPIFVTGAEDQRAPPSASPTVVELVGRQFRWSFNGGGSSFTMQVGQTYELRMRTLDVTHGFPGIPQLALEPAALAPGAAEIVRVVRPTSAQIGSYVFACDIECGSGHGFQGTINVASP
jgi:heme/copper-type cytochrome/quinol oxidase subunit 2